MNLTPHSHLEETSKGYEIVARDLSGKIHRFRVALDDVIRWKTGEPIQRALPYLTPGEREIIISGMTDAMYDKLTAEED